MAKSDTPKELIDALNLVRGTRAPKLESLDTLEARHVDRVRTIFEDRNIVGIGICEKQTENKNTGALGLCFYVEKKLAKARVKAGRIIPPVMSVADRTAVFTDVQQIGKVVPQINKRRTPLLSGYSVGNDTDTGTLGAVVKLGKKLCLLSNSHVLAKSGKAKKGEEIFYPGEADNTGKPQLVAKLAKVLALEPGNDFLNRVDGALAEIDDEFFEKIDFSIRGARYPLSTITPVRGMKIVTRGRTSGDTEGEVQDVNFSIVLEYPGGVGKIGFIDQVKCTRYSKSGDSGAIVVDKKSGKIVGLHFAGSGAASVFNPIDEVVKALKFSFADK